MWNALFSTPSLRANWSRLPHHADTMPVIGMWAGTREVSELRAFGAFEDAVDFSVKLCQQQGENCVLVFAQTGTEADKTALWEAPFSSFMDARRALADVPSWTWIRDNEGMHGIATIIGPYPRRLDAHKDANVSKVYAAFVDAGANAHELSADQYSEATL